MTELLKQAALLLAREATRIPAHSLSAARPLAAADTFATRSPAPSRTFPAAVVSEAELRHQVYEIIGSLLNLVGGQAGNTAPTAAARFPSPAPQRTAPAIGGSPRASAAREEQVPLVRCNSIVPAGETARARLRMSNQSDAAGPATLYCSNFVSDTGYEIPSVRVNMLPRQVVLPAGGSSDFEISIAVPEQTPAGSYAGLIRAFGSRDFQVVLSVEVS